MLRNPNAVHRSGEGTDGADTTATDAALRKPSGRAGHQPCRMITSAAIAPNRRVT